MNDYKELIEKLRMAGKSVELADGSFDIYLLTFEKCQETANAIEQLIKERDAAVADLGRYGRWCVTCKHRDKSDFSPNCTPIKCSTDKNEFWEWRGVQEDNSESSELYRVVVSNISHERAYSLLNKLTSSGFLGAMVTKERGLGE